jgi:hypothetical protein
MQFSNWKDVLEEVRKDSPGSGNWYIITKNKGTPDEERTRFLTYAEVVGLLQIKLRVS